MGGLLGEAGSRRRRSGVEKSAVGAILPPGPRTAPEASREKLQADAGADFMRSL